MDLTAPRKTGPADDAGEWVLLTYRVPREPSTARVALWRKLKRLGVAQLADGVVGLPADARTREQLEWLADEVLEGGGAAAVWTARPAGRATERELAAAMSEARAVEYRAVADEARGALDAPGSRAGLVRRLRGELRRIARRDHFPPPERDAARRAVEQLAAATDETREVTP